MARGRRVAVGARMRVLRTAEEATSCQQASRDTDGKRRTFGLEGCRLEIMSVCSRENDPAKSLPVAITMRDLSYHVPRQTATARDVIPTLSRTRTLFRCGKHHPIQTKYPRT